MLVLFLGFVLLIFTSAYIAKNSSQFGRFCFAAGDDSDVKIAVPGSIMSNSSSSGEPETNLYKTHKRNGNLEKAHSLGRSLAKIFLSGDFNRLCGEVENDNIRKNLILLFGFATVKAMGSMLDDILSDTAQNTFFDSIKGEDAVLYEKLRDNAKISFYFLEERTSKEKAEFGAVFASLCENSTPETAKFGEDMYNLFYELCYRKILDEEFVEFELNII